MIEILMNCESTCQSEGRPFTFTVTPTHYLEFMTKIPLTHRYKNTKI